MMPERDEDVYKRQYHHCKSGTWRRYRVAGRSPHRRFHRQLCCSTPVSYTHLKIPLDLIEVRSGSYLEEDDVVRFADRYGRV